MGNAKEPPVIICHVGNVPQLTWVLIQAARVMGRERVILLGDEGSLACWPGPGFSVYSYVNSSAEFMNIYQHLSANPKNYEAFCFVRWFAIREFMEQHGLESCFVMDSDLLLYESLDTLLPLFGSARFGNMPMLNFVRDRHILWELCSFFVSVYSDKYLLEAVKQRYMQTGEDGQPTPYVADLTLIGTFAEGRTDVFDMSGLGQQGYDFDISGDTDMFISECGRKEMTWDGREGPFYTYRENGKRLKVKAAHFMGPSKSSIPHYVDPWLFSR